MVMSTRTWHDAAALLTPLLVDRLLILNVGEPVTVGAQVTRSLTQVSPDTVPGLVQTISLENAVDGRVSQVISVKVPKGTELEAGQAVLVFTCQAEPTLVGQVFLLDNISQNGLALIRKGTATRANTVNQEGKEVLV